ncbi:zona pellucida sperm-binding protein 3-like [Myxocyprinus asiaticus]|uniref:zona pellucida sperm-binding protein 3-like n=1 Tax=Myxocyprinus asiaticus TaxID=70543 RepID=UPI002221DA2B|nr:zona pellucida sperm-binding protein 3-like [Myxocyprinus asiaticus]
MPQKIPFKIPVQMPVQDPVGVQSKQLLQGPVAKLAWTFPVLPQELEQPDIPFQLRHPVPANSVAAHCGENSIYVEVKEDFFGTGQLLMASAFTLGGCTAVGEDNTAQVLIFESELHGCGSIPTMTENELVYMFSLIYTPQEALHGSSIVRSSAALVGIECHYPRMQNVSSNALMPSWMPYATTRVAEDILVFSLRLMTEDWRFERPSNQYFLGDFINIEASVMSYNHVPVRVFVDSCLATTSPDINTTPSYTFIENNGCLVDAKITGSSSRFMPRMRGDKLQFQLEAFRFQQLNSGLVYITCILKVAAAFNPTNPEQKACSFSAYGWVSADESDQVCGCCDANCSIRTGSDQPVNDLQWQKATVGPVNVKDRGFGQM